MTISPASDVEQVSPSAAACPYSAPLGDLERTADAAPAALPAPTDELTLTALRVGASTMEIQPASPRREWMEATSERFANRCLPMLIANQAGWHVVLKHDVRVRWNGSAATSGLEVEAPGFGDDVPATSHFGHGILTFTLPWLFRTPTGWELLVRGPANLPRRGAHALEGVVETDWSPYTFTMNWALTDPGREVVFHAGEPVCLLVPQLRGSLERFVPAEVLIEERADEHQAFTTWRESRNEFRRELATLGADAGRRGWQRDYFLGNRPDAHAAGHRRRLRLRRFVPVHRG